MLALYVVYASTILDITWARFVAGLGHGARFLSRMFPPNVAPDKLELLYQRHDREPADRHHRDRRSACCCRCRSGLPPRATWRRCRSPGRRAPLIALFRTFHPVIVAILFVKAVGFGALAGVLALIVASLGFLSKLVAEAVEEMSMKQVEAVRATGAPFLSRRRSWACCRR